MVLACSIHAKSGKFLCLPSSLNMSTVIFHATLSLLARPKTQSCCVIPLLLIHFNRLDLIHLAKPVCDAELILSWRKVYGNSSEGEILCGEVCACFG